MHESWMMEAPKRSLDDREIANRQVAKLAVNACKNLFPTMPARHVDSWKKMLTVCLTNWVLDSRVIHHHSK